MFHSGSISEHDDIFLQGWGKNPIIHAIQPDGSTNASMGKKTIPLKDMNAAIQCGANGNILPSL